MLEWDPDGIGPAVAGFVFGGDFHAAGSTRVGNVAMFDAVTGWTGLRSSVGAPAFHGANGPVNDMAVLPTGEPVIVGEFLEVVTCRRRERGSRPTVSLSGMGSSGRGAPWVSASPTAP